MFALVNVARRLYVAYICSTSQVEASKRNEKERNRAKPVAMRKRRRYIHISWLAGVGTKKRRKHRRKKRSCSESSWLLTIVLYRNDRKQTLGVILKERRTSNTRCKRSTLCDRSNTKTRRSEAANNTSLTPVVARRCRRTSIILLFSLIFFSLFLSFAIKYSS
jgi:hypothetical protein